MATLGQAMSCRSLRIKVRFWSRVHGLLQIRLAWPRDFEPRVSRLDRRLVTGPKGLGPRVVERARDMLQAGLASGYCVIRLL